MLFQSEFVLNREHFEECFDQSLLLGGKATPKYKLMAFLVFAGSAIIVFADQQKTVGLFIISLSFVEYFSFRYRRAWWLMRQMWSKNSHNTITLTISERGVKTESLYNNNELLWNEIKHGVETPKGLMLYLKSGAKNYLSKSSLNKQAIAFIKLKVAQPVIKEQS
ncbi:conserved hypothetical protein [Psychromonas ingrahamii 37]|uniref:YcxB-like protein domain-containing protein n=1 Tax=Psychromonas ingrahamii (strain DSM 17664 / CCUG 51855 / 37) TaxID=357804 RepID=A1SSS0_PSYIN|nr:YcxB family protein [Psychromonas ingrahamii]ABM02535.1 conserved hypothetical protein [Psychromonas ingrahamii 37]